MYKHEFQIAKEELKFAFENCHKDYGKNKKKILRYLVPVQVTFNVFPQVGLLKKYQLQEYVDIIEACKNGDIKKFDENLEKHRQIFIKAGVFLIVEKMELQCLRNFFKNVYLAVQ